MPRDKSRNTSIVAVCRQRAEAQINGLISRILGVRSPDSALVSRSLLTSIAVLGKGSSLVAFIEGEEQHEAILLCNFTSRELGIPGLASRLNNKRLVVLSQIGEPVFAFRDLKRFPVDRAFVGRFSPTSGLPRSEKRRRGRLERYGRSVEYLPESPVANQLFSNAWHTGLAGVYLASHLASNIHLYGIDFQTSPNLMLQTFDNGILSQKAQEEGQDQLNRFGEFVSSINFESLHIHTTACVMDLPSNVFVYKI